MKIGQPKLSETFYQHLLDQGGNSSISTFSKKPFEYILSILIIAQSIPQSPSVLAHRSVTLPEKLSYLRPLSPHFAGKRKTLDKPLAER